MPRTTLVTLTSQKVTHMHARCFGLRAEDQRKVRSKAACLLCLIQVYKWQGQCCTLFTDIIMDIIIESLQSLANPHLVFCLRMINIVLEEANMQSLLCFINFCCKQHDITLNNLTWEFLSITMTLSNELHKWCMVAAFLHIASELEDVGWLRFSIRNVIDHCWQPQVLLFLWPHGLKLQGLLKITWIIVSMLLLQITANAKNFRVCAPIHSTYHLIFSATKHRSSVWNVLHLVVSCASCVYSFWIHFLWEFPGCCKHSAG